MTTASIESKPMSLLHDAIKLIRDECDMHLSYQLFQLDDDGHDFHVTFSGDTDTCVLPAPEEAQR